AGRPTITGRPPAPTVPSMSIRPGGLSAVVLTVGSLVGFLLGTPGCNRPAGTTSPTDPAPAATAGGGWFEDVTDAVGLTFTHECGPTGKYFMPQAVYGGGALFDADGDGRLDILLLQGAG